MSSAGESTGDAPELHTPGVTFKVVQHTLWAIALSAACLVGPSYTSALYFFVLFLHSLYHEVNLYWSGQTIKVFSVASPYAVICVLTLVISLVHIGCVTALNIVYSSKKGDSFDDWYYDYRAYLEGFGVYVYEEPIGNLDRMLRHTIPSGVVLVASALRFVARRKGAKMSSVHLLFASLPGPAAEGAPDERSRLVLSRRKMLPIASIPLITLLCALAACTWPRVMTVPYLGVFIILVVSWGLNATGSVASPRTLRRFIMLILVITKVSLVVQFTAQLRFVEDDVDNRCGACHSLGIIRLKSSSDFFFNAEGRQYLAYLATLVVMFWVAWWTYYHVTKIYCQALLENRMDDLDTSTTAGVIDRSVVVNPITRLPGPDRGLASPEIGVSEPPMVVGQRTSRAGDEELETKKGSDQRDSEKSEKLESPAHAPAGDVGGDMELADEDEAAAEFSDVDDEEDEEEEEDDGNFDDYENMLAEAQGHERRRRGFNQAYYARKAVLLLAQYSPSGLGLVLGVVALVDSSFLSGIWLLTLYFFLWTLLMSGDTKVLVNLLPTLLCWSAVHVSVIFASGVPGVFEYSDDTMKRLSAIGVIRRTNSTLALVAHSCLMILNAVVIRLSSLAPAAGAEDDSSSKRQSKLLDVTVGNMGTTTLLENRTAYWYSYIVVGLKNELLMRAQYVTLLILVVVGCLHVDLIQASLIFAFVLFASSTDVARKYWVFLVAWCIVVTTFLYGYNVYTHGWGIPRKLGNLQWDILVEEPLDSMLELTPFLLLVFFSIWQLKLYGASSVAEAALAADNENPKTAVLQANLSMFCVWVTMLVVVAFSSPTIMTAGYLIIFVWASAVTSFGGGVRSANLVFTWVVLLSYAASCFVALYLFQFEDLRSGFAEVVNVLFDCSDEPTDGYTGDADTFKELTVCVAQFGFKRYSGVGTRAVGLIPHWALFTLSLWQLSRLRSVWKLSGRGEAQDAPDPASEDASSNSRYVIAMDHGRTALPDFHKYWGNVVKRTKRAIMVVAPFCMYLAIYFAATQSRTLIAAGFFVMLTITLVTGRVNSLLLCTYAALTIGLNFWYQYSFFPSFVSDSATAYFGLGTVSTPWACQTLTSEDECATVAGCSWTITATLTLTLAADEEAAGGGGGFFDLFGQSRSVLRHQDAFSCHGGSNDSLFSIVWADLLVVVAAMLCRRARLWAQDAAQAKCVSVEKYLQDLTIFNHPVDPFAPVDAGGGAAPAAAPEADGESEEDKFLASFTEDQIRKIVRLQAYWRGHAVRDRLSHIVLVETKEGKTLKVNDGSIEVIISAHYCGDNNDVEDVTHILRRQIQDGGLNMDVNDPTLGIDRFMGIGKILRLTYVPQIAPPKPLFKRVTQVLARQTKLLRKQLWPMVIRFVHWLAEQLCWIIDFGYLFYSYEITLGVLLIVSASRQHLVESVVYVAILAVLLRKGRTGGLWLSHCIVWIASMLWIQMVFYIGMPEGWRDWGPFMDREDMGGYTYQYYEYLGLYPNKYDLFAGFVCFFAIMQHFRYNKRFKRAIPKHPNAVFYGAATLTEYLEQKVDGEKTRREAVIELTHRVDSTIEELCALLPKPLTPDVIVKPKTVPARMFGYWLMFLPYICLVGVFVDSTVASFISVFRMGKLAFAMYFFYIWDRMEWQGNRLWRYLVYYFLFCLFIHQVQFIPHVADRWESASIWAKLYSFFGVIECRYVDGECFGSFIVVNASEVLLMVLLYLQKRNYDHFEHIFVLHNSFVRAHEARSVREEVAHREKEKKERGLALAREMAEDRRKILETTKRELAKNLEESTGRTGPVVSFAPQVFPPPKLFDDPDQTPQERSRRATLRKLLLRGYAVGPSGSFPTEFETGVDNRLFIRRMKESFSLGQDVTIGIPPHFKASKQDYIRGLLEGPLVPASDDAPAAFRAGKAVAAFSLPASGTNLVVLILAAAVAASHVQMQKDTRFYMKVVQFLNRHSLLGTPQVLLTPAAISRKPMSYIRDGAISFLKTHTDMICFMVFAINYCVSVSILDMIPSASAFLYALLANPRPAAAYWQYMLIYIQCLLALKCVIQSIERSFDYSVPATVLYGKLGRNDFFANVFGDFSAIVAILVRQAVLRSWGLYNPNEKKQVNAAAAGAGGDEEDTWEAGSIKKVGSTMKVRRTSHRASHAHHDDSTGNGLGTGLTLSETIGRARQGTMGVKTPRAAHPPHPEGHQPDEAPPRRLPSRVGPKATSSSRRAPDAAHADDDAVTSDPERRGGGRGGGDSPPRKAHATDESDAERRNGNNNNPPGTPRGKPRQRRERKNSTSSVVSVRSRVQMARNASSRSQQLQLQQGGPRKKGSWMDRKASMSSLAATKTVVDEILDDRKKQGGTRDLYVYGLAIDLLSFIFFIAFYAFLGTEEDFSLAESIAQNLLPGALVMGMIILVLTMVVDRVVYLFSDLKAKFVTQIGLGLFYHFFFFSWFSKYGVENKPTAHAFGSILLLSRALWLGIAAKQITSGYPEIRRHDCFTATNDPTIFTLYKVVRAIPFLWELRVLLDWSCSKTTLNLDDWLKLEDVRNEMLERKMQIRERKETNPRPGVRFPFAKKCTSGWLFITIILVLLFFPLLYYSTFSPVLAANSVQQLTVGTYFDGTPPLYQNEYLVRANEQEKDVGLARWLSLTRRSARRESVTSTNKNLQLLQLTNYSTDLWSVTTPAVEDLANTLGNEEKTPPQLVISMDVLRAQGQAGELELKTFIRYNLNPANRHMMEGLVGLLNWNGSNPAPSPVSLPLFYTPMLLNKPSDLFFASRAVDCELAVAITTSEKFFSLNCRGLFACGNQPTTEREIDCMRFETDCPNYDEEPLPPCNDPGANHGYVPFYFVAISDMAATSNALTGLFNIGIVALYVTFVLAIGKVFRTMLSGSAAAAFIKDMHDPSFIAHLADHVHLARGEGNLILEEELYFHLINIIRSPATILRITGLRRS